MKPGMKPSEAGLSVWPYGTPKRAAFDVALSGGRRESRVGYVLGAFAVRAPVKGEYFWALTHTPTGLAVNVYPPPENKAQALELLSSAAGGHLKAHIRAELERCAGLGWGAGL